MKLSLIEFIGENHLHIVNEVNTIIDGDLQETDIAEISFHAK